MTAHETLALIAAAIFGLGFTLTRLRLRAAGSRRMHPGDLLRHFDPADAAPDVIHAVCEEIARWESRQALAPNFDLRTVYGLERDEIEFAVQSVAARCGRVRAPSTAHVHTIDDWVKTVSSLPHKPELPNPRVTS